MAKYRLEFTEVILSQLKKYTSNPNFLKPNSKSMKIFNYFNNLILSLDQKKALIKLETFIDSSAPIFILKGYAGSGKTTILKGLIEHLSLLKKEYLLMAPTGRAAKVLRDKTGIGSTIHKGIYNFSSLVSVNQDSLDDAEHSVHYSFPINEIESNQKIIIVDESSMISSKESKHELFTFGTNNLLDDLMTFAKLQHGKNKIIFVGDPAQLPPYGDNKSQALEREYFQSLGLAVEETEMKEVLRQGDNLILKNATLVREVLEQKNRSFMKFEFDDQSFVKIDERGIIEKYAFQFPNPEIGNGVVISHSNAQSYHYNMAIRTLLFPGEREIVAGDLIMINNNNYHTYGAELFNGDIAKVISVSPNPVTQNAPVYCDVNGSRVKKNIDLMFRKISLRIPTHPDEIHCYIIDSLLNSINRDLSIDEMKALYINFMMRFNEEQRKNKELGLAAFKVGSEEFKQALKQDPFYNALKIKYGYAITCHKAQGGEWDTVFVDYSGRVSLADDPLRWCYTATTRGIKTLFAVNSPQFGKLDKFKFNSIGAIGTLPNDSLCLDSVAVSPFHKPSDHKCKSLKYWEILEKLENTNYSIINVESFGGGFQERYTFINDELEIIADAFHKGSGHFPGGFKVINQVDESLKAELESILNADFTAEYQLNYTPDKEFLADLYSMMQAECSELNIAITNIVDGNNYYISYYLKTDSLCSYIQFYYNAIGQLTTALPKSYQCTEDKKLEVLIQKLLSYAS